jgi:hypothetical protein
MYVSKHLCYFLLFLPLWPLLHEVEQQAFSRVANMNLASCHNLKEPLSLCFHYFGQLDKFELSFWRGFEIGMHLSYNCVFASDQLHL